MRPVIGVTPDEGQTVERPGRPSLKRYELKQAYTNAVFRAGGLPIVLPYTSDAEAIAQYLGSIRGLVVTGGAFDVPPEEYGETASPQLGPVHLERTRFERRLLEGALSRELPVLGICGGMQLLNVVLGGTLIQDLSTEMPTIPSHEQKHDPQTSAHPVLVEEDSRLARAAGVREMQVNTTHHQAIKRLGAGLRVTGRSPDGLIEAIEGSGAFFVLGVQWHPELLTDAANADVYKAFVDASA